MTDLRAVEQIPDPGLGLVLERGVADAERLVDQQDVRIDLGGDGKRQPHVHAAGIILERHVGELAQPGELVDPIDQLQHPAAAEAQHRAIEQDVVGAGELGVEAGPHLDQGGDVAADRDLAGVGG